MGVLCRKCYVEINGGNTPAVRTQKAPCDLCGNQHDLPNGMNFDYPDQLMPNNRENPNAKAEREARQ